MSTFILYLRLGYRHVIDIYNVDHMIFVLALVAVFQLRDWRKVLILLLFYLTGISLSLSLSAYRLVSPNPQIIEYFIPVTIFIAAVANIIRGQKFITSKNQSKFALTIIYGIVHGFGFSIYLKNIMGIHRAVTVPLVAFNIGIVLGILLIVILFLIITWIFVNNLGVSRRDWYLIISSAIAGIALTMMFESRYWLD